MRVLITGDAGFVGRHFRTRLEHEGHSVVGLDIASKHHPVDCRRFFERDHTKFDLVVHCAAIVGGRAKIDGQPLAIADNLSIDAEMFQWALRTRPGRIVYFSSSAAYPTQLQAAAGHRLTEDDINLALPALPDQTYGWSKLTGEILAQCAIAEGLPVSIFRPFSGYGEDQALDYPFPSFAARAVAQADPFEIWGDGTQVRDWIHIDDIVGAVLAALQFGIEGPINLGWGEPVSFGELAMMFFEYAGYTPSLALLTSQPKGVSYRCSNAAKMLSFYAPRVSLEEGIVRALAHFSTQLALSVAQ